jgi:hypothetical protein
LSRNAKVPKIEIILLELIDGMPQTKKKYKKKKNTDGWILIDVPFLLFSLRGSWCLHS